MVNAGDPRVRMGADNWAVYSQDGSLAAHFEHTVAITAEGPRILTPWHLSAGMQAPAAARAAS
jgi:methionyl aminopeptidase